ncbi:MAG: choice-of-anchor L domain-containing protein [Myxococcales bacterium]|nr:choice-of-anchor L domain-containing protein [Myxococcales bacterium]
MQRNLLCWIGAGLGAHLLIACGDDANLTDGVTASESNGFTTGESAESSGNGANPTSGPDDTTGIGGSMTEAATSTTTGEVLTTDVSTSSTTGPSTDPSTSSSTDPSGTSSTGDTGDTSTGDTGDTSTGDTGETTDTTTSDPADCPLIAQHVPCDEDSDDALHAMGLNCTSLGGNWQNNVNAISVANLDFQAPPPVDGEFAWAVATSYGSYIDPQTQKPFWSPREGGKFLLISSGTLDPADGDGNITIADSDVYNDSGFGSPWDDDDMPPPMSPEHGSPDPMGYTNCDGVKDCSNTILDQWDLGFGDAEDKMWFHFELTAPALANGDMVDANGYTFDFAYFSAEFPEYVDSQFNDIFVVWQVSDDYTGNVTFINGQPLTVTALWPIDFQGECDFFDPQCNGADPHLQGTGYIDDGGATSWYKATGGIKPGETFLLSFGIFDMGDSSFDTTAIIDNFQWDCEGCVPNEVMSCGIDPQ